MENFADRPLRVVIAGGGTGGHLYPAIAIKEALRAKCPKSEFTFVGTSTGMESRVLPARGESLKTLWVSGLKRGSLLQNAGSLLKLAVSLFQSWKLLRRLRPHVVIGTGGYVMGPVLFIAQRMNVPTLIQEQNSYPGLTTRKLARRADAICIAFEDAARRLGTNNCRLTGNPVRSDFRSIEKQRAAELWGLDQNRRTLIVIGGSQGAKSINRAISELLPAILDSLNLIWQTGKSGMPPETDSSLVECESAAGHLRVQPFIDDMPSAYACADLAVCRAGAMTIAELAICGLPAIMIPFPFATDDHQTANAKSLVDAGAALLIADKDLTAEKLMNCVNTALGSSELLNEMNRAMLRLAKPEAAEDIADIALKLARQ